MRISEMFNNKKTVISFEIFPPKNDMPVESIYQSLEQFKLLNPDYISVTYGAGGTQKDRTIEISSKIKNEYNVETMAHFTCVGHTIDEIDEMLDSLKDNNLENILALRGDPPANQPDFDFNNNAFHNASELVAHLRENHDFCISAAAYMEGHVDCLRLKDDMLFLKKKVDEGVDFLVTQLFFDNRLYYDFVDRALALGINCPITAGIMPIFKADQIKNITSKSGCSIPAKLVLMMDKYHDNPSDLKKAGIEYAAAQLSDLVKNGAAGVHLYTMNRPKATAQILEYAGLIL